ncbi:hypothetical protein N802_07030 [Knoellia sinensis KCTC 19936]|uniref:Protein-glutamine gamma-glutamyltransferase-like C-terminal domain-containing protein n=1 Tax=Knoellia sinensis KCTC 19936 TaxID=1385520 RepID=A0A0A0IYW9_9MICO|nr:DUF4129 domain-containing protein [Knoellia sinensis]KGN30390.1 hypothetical protein N802_07030 [Knoellia sinensis KCTC 19936]
MTPLDTPPLDPSRSEGRRWLEDELAKAKYDVEPSLWDRFVEWLLGLFDTTGPGLPGWVFGLVLVLALALVALIAGALLRPEARARRTATDHGVLDERGVDATAYRNRAKRALRERDWDTAVLDGYRAIVASSVERTILDELPGRTAHEASLELSRAFPADGAGVRAGADRFDAVRYGHDAASEEDARAMLALDDRLGASRPDLASAGGAA